MELNTSRGAATCSVTQVFPSILRNRNVHHRVHKSPPLVHILSQTDPIHTTSSYLFTTYLNVIHPLTFWSS
jgi:hypothetical protein